MTSHASHIEQRTQGGLRVLGPHLAVPEPVEGSKGTT